VGRLVLDSRPQRLPRLPASQPPRGQGPQGYFASIGEACPGVFPVAFCHLPTLLPFFFVPQALTLLNFVGYGYVSSSRGTFAAFGFVDCQPVVIGFLLFQVRGAPPCRGCVGSVSLS